MVSVICILKMEDDNLTEEILHSILNKCGKELNDLLNRVQKFNSNIVESNAYFFKY